jgi:hypothetical protein
MDPVTLLGAIGSVVGIAGFGLQLAQFLDGFVTDAIEANDSCHAVLEGIEATNHALEEVMNLLEEERENLNQGHKMILFSDKALSKLQTTADNCLKIFWKIEAIILKKDNKHLEAKLKTRLAEFHAEVKDKKDPPVLKIDKSLRLTRFQHIAWSFNIGNKMEKLSRQLHRYQTTLILIFSVISIRANMTNPYVSIAQSQDARLMRASYAGSGMIRESFELQQQIRHQFHQSDLFEKGSLPPYSQPPYAPIPSTHWYSGVSPPFPAAPSAGGRRASIRQPSHSVHANPETPARLPDSDSEIPRRGRRSGRGTHRRNTSRNDDNNTTKSGRSKRRHNLSGVRASTPTTGSGKSFVEKKEAAEKYIAKHKPNQAPVEEVNSQEQLPTRRNGPRRANLSSSSSDNGKSSTAPQRGSSSERSTGNPISVKLSTGHKQPSVVSPPPSYYTVKG